MADTDMGRPGPILCSSSDLSPVTGRQNWTGGAPEQETGRLGPAVQLTWGGDQQQDSVGSPSWVPVAAQRDQPGLGRGFCPSPVRWVLPPAALTPSWPCLHSTGEALFSSHLFTSSPCAHAGHTQVWTPGLDLKFTGPSPYPVHPRTVAPSSGSGGCWPHSHLLTCHVPSAVLGLEGHEWALARQGPEAQAPGTCEGHRL